MISINKQCQNEILPLLISCKHLSTITSYDQLTELNLSNLKLLKIDRFPFEQFPKLKSLDLSSNQLISINIDWSKTFLNSIEYLNLSSNKLETLLFLKDFKYLKILNITENLLRNNERFLSLYICPTIEHLIDFNQEQIYNDQIKYNQLLIQLNSFPYYKKQKICEIVFGDFRQTIINLIEKQEIFSEFSLSPLGNYFIEKKFNEFYLQIKQNFQTYLTDDFQLLMNIKETTKTNYFQPIKLFHSHHQSKEDLTTISVHMCAFVPNTSNHILATCGGQKVCFINCNTCEITHLFELTTLSSKVTSNTKKLKDKNKTYFSCLSWIEIEDLKILAVGATNGSIYLLSPKWKLMFGHIELPNSSINCLTWHSSNPFTLVIGSYHTVRFINIRSYIDRLQSFIRKQNKPTVPFDYVDSSMFINKVSSTHIYNLYDGHGPLILITDLLFYPLSNNNNSVLLVGTTSGLFVIKYQDKQNQSPIQLALPKSIWTVSEHIESLRLINNPIRLIAMNILNLDYICYFDLDQSLKHQQLHIIHSLPNPSRQIPTKMAIYSTNNADTSSFECIVGSNHGSFFYHKIQSHETKKSICENQQIEISILPNILSASLNEHYLCLTTNNNLICIYKRQ
ncbi:unnamed protein product [Adineta steineri]|uniref:Uncharacterized protein n=1 Tax=Adineta steineri TaxID=433720 RepID=A0A813UQ54_9BILA|nr:unnamed protein product [Adineta steineri]CAF0829985.1 unnamed protein product [Adineta steineri]